VLGLGLSCSGCFYFYFSGGRFAIVKRDARLDLVLVLAGLILLQAFAGEK